MLLGEANTIIVKRPEYQKNMNQNNTIKMANFQAVLPSGGHYRYHLMGATNTPKISTFKAF